MLHNEKLWAYVISQTLLCCTFHTYTHLAKLATTHKWLKEVHV